jgi:SAM-dependent methyltransferase
VFERTGLRLENLHLLEVGSGEEKRYLRRLALRNEAVGIDTDVVDETVRRGDCFRSLWHGSAIRALEALRRMMLGDHRTPDVAPAVARGSEMTLVASPRFLRMSASQMSFADATFGFVCSFSGFEQIDDPGGALREVVRVLRPGGVAYIQVCPYTSHSGHRCARLPPEDAPQPPFWPHLRPPFDRAVQANPHLNRLSLKEWRLFLTHIMPGVEVTCERQDDELGEPLAELRARGELPDYLDDELLTVRLIAVWKKRRGSSFSGPGQTRPTATACNRRRP